MITCIVVEDEPLARERLVEYVGRLPILALEGTFESAVDALTFLGTHPVDLVLLDIQLGGWSGIDLLETSAVTSQVVVTTAHQEHAPKAFDLKVTDYLLKPFTFERFVQAIDRVRTFLERTEPPGERKFIFVKTEFRLEKVVLSEVLYIEGKGDYRQIHTTRKQIMTLETFGDLERRIASDLICRVHKSYMVSVDRSAGADFGDVSGAILHIDRAPERLNRAAGGARSILQYRAILMPWKQRDIGVASP
jgi:DNA-binding LytR/AlgR family response regulator